MTHHLQRWGTALALRFQQLKRGEEGQGLLEYALIISLVVLIAAAALSPLGEAISNKFVDITGQL
jgi:Flp pilus assembly pilin Flp